MVSRTQKRVATAVIGVTAVAVATTGVAFALKSTSHQPPPDKPAAVTAPTPTPTPTPLTSASPTQSPAIPARGAYIGAYVQPNGYSQAQQVAAIRRFQHQLGRKLAIIHSYLRWDGRFPTKSQEMALSQGSALLVSWTGNDTQAVAAGTYDRQIRKRALAMKALHKPIFLEWRWEMNRGALQGGIHSPRDYIRAWDHVHAIFARAKVKNVAWVWCPSSKGWGNVPHYLPGPEFYPGNKEVDWICADVYPRFGGYSSFASSVRPFLAWASHINKPIMFGEVGAPLSYTPQQRVQWLRGMAQTVRKDSQVKALVYFNGSPPGRPLLTQYGLDPGSAPFRAFRAIAAESYFGLMSPPGPKQ